VAVQKLALSPRLVQKLPNNNFPMAQALISISHSVNNHRPLSDRLLPPWLLVGHNLTNYAHQVPPYQLPDLPGGARCRQKGNELLSPACPLLFRFHTTGEAGFFPERRHVTLCFSSCLKV
jgi:hypothetical protein